MQYAGTMECTICRSRVPHVPLRSQSRVNRTSRDDRQMHHAPMDSHCQSSPCDTEDVVPCNGLG